jgi:hypothetical protein
MTMVTEKHQTSHIVNDIRCVLTSMIYDCRQLEAQAFAKACSCLDEDIVSCQSRNDDISLKRSTELVRVVN